MISDVSSLDSTLDGMLLYSAFLVARYRQVCNFVSLSTRDKSVIILTCYNMVATSVSYQRNLP